MIMLALTDGDGVHRATVCVARDGTDLHEVEQRLVERERWYRALVQNAADVVVVLDEDLSVRFASPMCRDLLGRGPRRARRAVSAPSVVHPDDLELLAAALHDVP